MTLVGYIVYDSWRSGESPPAFVVTVESVTQVPSGYRVQFRAENVGATAAEGVIIQARSASAGREEISHTTLDYVPGGAARRGGLFSSSDPRGAELSIRALGYKQP